MIGFELLLAHLVTRRGLAALGGGPLGVSR